MTTVRENLIAAKALIDTPEKFVDFDARPVLAAVSSIFPDTPAGDKGYSEARDELTKANGGFLVGVSGFSFENAMALFDRAIASLPLNAEGDDK